MQSRDVREFFYRSIPVIASLRHDTSPFPLAESWSSNLLSPPESKLSLIEGTTFAPSRVASHLTPRPLPTRTSPPNQRHPPRNLPRPRILQLQHGLRNLFLPDLPLPDPPLQHHRARRGLRPPRRRSPVVGPGCRGQGMGEARRGGTVDAEWGGRGGKG